MGGGSDGDDLGGTSRDAKSTIPLNIYLTYRIEYFNAFSTPFNASLTPGVEFQRRSTPV